MDVNDAEQFYGQSDTGTPAKNYNPNLCDQVAD
jgi:hypothetical protein